MIKILMPEKIRKVADILRKIGYKKQVERNKKRALPEGRAEG
jgi:hypothetical protein